LIEKNEEVILEPFEQFFVLFGEQSCEVFRIAGFRCVVAFGAEFLVVADEVGSVKWYRVFCFEDCGSARVELSANEYGLYLIAVLFERVSVVYRSCLLCILCAH
jgi:hypothetical protein